MKLSKILIPFLIIFIVFILILIVRINKNEQFNNNNYNEVPNKIPTKISALCSRKDSLQQLSYNYWTDCQKSNPEHNIYKSTNLVEDDTKVSTKCYITKCKKTPSCLTDVDEYPYNTWHTPPGNWNLVKKQRDWSKDLGTIKSKCPGVKDWVNVLGDYIGANHKKCRLIHEKRALCKAIRSEDIPPSKPNTKLDCDKVYYVDGNCKLKTQINSVCATGADDSWEIYQFKFKKDENINFLYTLASPPTKVNCTTTTTTPKNTTTSPNDIITLSFLTKKSKIKEIKNGFNNTTKSPNQGKTLIYLKNSMTVYNPNTPTSDGVIQNKGSIHIVDNTKLTDFKNYLNPTAPVSNNFVDNDILSMIRNTKNVTVTMGKLLSSPKKNTPTFVITNYGTENQGQIVFLNYTLLNDYTYLASIVDKSNMKEGYHFDMFQRDNAIITFCSNNIITNKKGINKILNFDFKLDVNGNAKINDVSNENTDPKLFYDPLKGCQKLKDTSCALCKKNSLGECVVPSKRNCSSEITHNTDRRQAKRCGPDIFKQLFPTGEGGTDPEKDKDITNDACGKFALCGIGEGNWAKGIISCKEKDSEVVRLITLASLLVLSGSSIFLELDITLVLDNLLNAVINGAPCTQDKFIGVPGGVDCDISSSGFLSVIDVI